MPSYLLIPLMIVLSSCATRSEPISTVEEGPKWTPDTRVAHALIDAGDISEIQGQVDFEQMPNSVIVTYHIEGLQPKNHYQMYLHKDQTCNSLDAKVAKPFARVRARPDGMAENTFKSENITVAKGEQALAGDAIVIRSLDEELGAFQPAVACSEVRPREALQ
jgi:hypothetical protein